MPNSRSVLRLYGLGVFALLGAKFGAEQQLRHADHAVERRADLVAHVAEELGANTFRLECKIARALHLFLGGFALPDVVQDHHRAEDRIVGPERVARRSRSIGQTPCSSHAE